MGPKNYDFMVAFYIDEITHLKTSQKEKIKTPIYLAYVFTLEIKEKYYTIKNFNIGYLNHTILGKYSIEIREKILKNLDSKDTFQILSASPKKDFVHYILI